MRLFDPSRSLTLICGEKALDREEDHGTMEPAGAKYKM
jgi:hypothetical protein